MSFKLCTSLVLLIAVLCCYIPSTSARQRLRDQDKPQAQGSLQSTLDKNEAKLAAKSIDLLNYAGVGGAVEPKTETVLKEMDVKAAKGDGSNAEGEDDIDDGDDVDGTRRRRRRTRLNRRARRVRRGGHRGRRGVRRGRGGNRRNRRVRLG